MFHGLQQHNKLEMIKKFLNFCSQLEFFFIVLGTLKSQVSFLNCFEYYHVYSISKEKLNKCACSAFFLMETNLTLSMVLNWYVFNKFIMATHFKKVLPIIRLNNIEINFTRDK